MDVEIGSSGVVGAWVAEAVLGALARKPDAHRLLHFAVTPIGEGQGFISHIYKCALTWAPPDHALPSRLVVKIPTVEHIEAMDMGAAMKEEGNVMVDVFVPTTHRNECVFYDFFRTHDSPIPIPRTFFAREITSTPGVILMEDLSEGTKVVSSACGFRLSQMENIVRMLGQIHGWSLSHSGWSEKLTPIPKTAFAMWPDILKSSAVKLETIDPNLKDKMSQFEFTLDPDYLCSQLYESAGRMGLPSVLCHGDLWTNNVIMAADAASANGAGDSVVAFIDWQMCHSGNLGYDLAIALGTGLTGAQRRLHTDALLALYQRTLAEATPDGKAPVSAAGVAAAYAAFLPMAVAFQMIQVPLMLNVGEGGEEGKATLLSILHDLLDDAIALPN